MDDIHIQLRLEREKFMLDEGLPVSPCPWAYLPSLFDDPSYHHYRLFKVSVWYGECNEENEDEKSGEEDDNAEIEKANRKRGPP